MCNTCLGMILRLRIVLLDRIMLARTSLSSTLAISKGMLALHTRHCFYACDCYMGRWRGVTTWHCGRKVENVCVGPPRVLHPRGLWVDWGWVHFSAVGVNTCWYCLVLSRLYSIFVALRMPLPRRLTLGGGGLRGHDHNGPIAR